MFLLLSTFCKIAYLSIILTYNCCCSVTQPCQTHFDPMNYSTPSLPCSSPSSRTCSNSCPLSWWCHPIIILCHPLLLLPSVFPRIRVSSNELALRIRWSKTRASASESVLPMNSQDWFPLELTGLISLQSKELSRVFSNTTVQKSINSLALSLLYGPTLTSIHDYWKNYSFD